MSRRLTQVIPLLCLALISAPSRATAQATAAPRAPRFLLASGMTPIPLDIARTAVLRKRVDLNFDDTPVREALAVITERAGLHLTYTDDILSKTARVRLHATDITVAAALTEILLDAEVDIVFSATNRAALVRRARGAIPVATGTIHGQVFEEQTLRPLPLAQIIVAGTNIRALTNDSGTYVLRNVPVGKAKVSARLLGFSSRSIIVTVTDSGTTPANFTLSRQATVLTDVVSTATGSKRRAEVAAQVSYLNVDSVMSTAPIRTMTDLLADRIPGVQVQRGSGDVSAPVRIRIGGISSATLSNDPIVILDGVRIAGPTTTGNGINRFSTPLDDIDPRSLESVEVVHGPAAAALYGTDAANGIIILKSKKGKEGPTRWGFNAAHSWTSVPTKSPPIYTGYGHLPGGNVPSSCDLLMQGYGFCVMDSVSGFNPANSPFTTRIGRNSNTQYSLNASGGSSQINYSLTGTHLAALNPEKMSAADLVRARRYGLSVPSMFRSPSDLSSTSLSGTLSLQPSSVVNVGFTANVQRESQNRRSMASNLATADTLAPTSFSQGVSADAITSIFGALSAAWHAIPSLSIEGTVGMQRTANTPSSWATTSSCESDGCLPNKYALDAMSFGSNTIESYTSHASISYQTKIGPLFTSTTSILGDYTRSSTVNMQTSGARLTKPDISTAEKNESARDTGATATAGISLAQIIGFRERMFLTIGARRDAGSAFGSNIKAPIYPQFGLSWLVSNEPFFPTSSLINNMQLRFAFGQSGVQPRYEEAHDTYEAGAGNINGQPVQVYTLTYAANRLLKPERSAQMEGGVTADLLNNRLHLDVTFSEKRSHDAIIPRQLAPSAPASYEQSQNIGSVMNRTMNLSTSVQLLDNSFTRWNVNVGASMLRNKVITLGNGLTTSAWAASRIVPGYPLDGTWQRPVLAVHVPTDGSPITIDDIVVGDTSVFVGFPQPRYTLSYTTSFSFPRPQISISADVSFQGKYLVEQIPYSSPGLFDANVPLAEQIHAAVMKTLAYGNAQNVSVLRFNSVQISWALPPRIARQFLRAQSASLSFGGSNLGMWTKYKGADPSVNSYLSSGNAGSDFNSDTGDMTPLTRNWSLSLSLGF